MIDVTVQNIEVESRHQFQVKAPDFEIQIEESDRCTVSTIVDAAAGKIEDRSIFIKAKEKFNMAFEDAMDEFVKRLVSRE